MTLTTVGRRDVETTTGEILCDLDRLGLQPEDRNRRKTPAEAREALRGSVFAGRRPVLEDLPADYHGLKPYWCPHTGDMWTCARCNFGLTGKQVPRATEAQRRAATRDDIAWHYRGALIWAGRDAEGDDYTRDVRSGKVERAYSLNQRREAMKLAEDYGLSAASRKTGIPRTTLKNWRARGF
jgi:hypothetical protein